jgi:integrase
MLGCCKQILYISFDPIIIETLRKQAWTKGLKKTELEYRPVIQTLYTFATMMISSGENLGWVQKMMGHSTLKKIADKYFSYIPNMTHQDGSKFLEEYERRGKIKNRNTFFDKIFQGVR